MLKIRVQATTEAEAKAVIKQRKAVFPDLNFTYPKEGNNPKYKGRQSFFSHGSKYEKSDTGD